MRKGLAWRVGLEEEGRGRPWCPSLRIAALVLLIAVGCSDAPGGEARYAWLQLGQDGVRIARAITDDAVCPELVLDSRIVSMQVRAAPDPPAFPVLTCEAVVPAEVTHVAIGSAELPLPPAEVKRLAVIGDTGCRIQDGMTTQACNDPQQWPFAGIASMVSELVSWLTGAPEEDDFNDLAQSIASLDPDVIVHVGDYLYREDACPDGDLGCVGSPYGFNWATIEADFFAPAEPMFGKAPLVLTRGNHEACNLAGPIWFRFLDPRPLEATCDDFTAPYPIEVGGLQFLMLDSSAANDTTVDPAQEAIYRAQFAELRRIASTRSFLVTHRPMWVFSHSGEMGGQETLARGNATLQAASDNQLPAPVEAVLSGHVHLFQLLAFDPARAPQVVVGNSATELGPVITTPLGGLEIGDADVAVGQSVHEFGFMTLEAEPQGWRLTARDLDGAVLQECGLSGFEVSCE